MSDLSVTGFIFGTDPYIYLLKNILGVPKLSGGGIGFYPIVGWEEKKVVKTSV